MYKRNILGFLFVVVVVFLIKESEKSAKLDKSFVFFNQFKLARFVPSGLESVNTHTESGTDSSLTHRARWHSHDGW